MPFHYWNTPDQATNSNLTKLDSVSDWRLGGDGEEVHRFLSAVINCTGMLPRSVRKHFELPNLFVGNAHFTNGQAYRDGLVSSICAALKEGMEKAVADPALTPTGDADFSDRPRTRGEAILEAVEAFERDMSQKSLTRLKHETIGTHMHYRAVAIGMLMSRKKPIGNQSPKQAIYGEMFRLRDEASSFHHERA